MSIKIEKTENANELKLEFKIEAAKFDEAIQTVYNKNKKYFNVPGFRKGKVPMNMVEKYYGVEVFYEDAFNEVVPEVFDKELKDNKIEAVSRPDIDITQIGKGKELIFTAIVQTKPEVKAPKYKGIEIPKIVYTVSEEDIEHELHHMQEHNSRLVTIEDRPVQNGDTAVIDFEGFVDGKAFEGGKAQNHELEIGSHSFIDGFEDQVIGMKIDEEKEIKVKFPDEYFSKDLAGKDATFKVKVHEIKMKEVPELDDEFAKDASEFDTLKELKEDIKAKLEKSNAEKSKAETEDAAVKAVCDETEIEIPSGMIETEIDNMVKDIDTRLSYQGMNIDSYLKMMGKTMAEFRKQYEEQAKISVKSKLVLEAIGKDAKVEVSDEEMKAKIKEMAEIYGRKEEELANNESFKNYLKEHLTTEKTIELIVKEAKFKAEKKEKTEKASKTKKSE